MVFLGYWDFGTFSITLSLLLGLEAIDRRVRSYSYWTDRFSSPVSRQGWEVFHRLIKLVFLLSFPLGSGGFSST